MSAHLSRPAPKSKNQPHGQEDELYLLTGQRPLQPKKHAFWAPLETIS